MRTSTRASAVRDGELLLDGGERVAFDRILVAAGRAPVALAGALVWIGRRLRIRAPGPFALYVAGYSGFRIFAELLRVDPAHHILGLRLKLYVAATLCAIGLAWFVRTQRGCADLPAGRRWTMRRPTWIAFDLNGTLLDPAAMLDGEHTELARAALDDAVLQAMADTLTGEHRPFPEYLRAALQRSLRVAGIEDAVLDEAMTRARTLPAFPDAAEALNSLAAAGYRVAVVTNSARDAAQTALAAAGLDRHVAMVIGADEVRAYKPDPRVYLHAATRLGVQPDGVLLVAAHAWDVLGAQRAGWGAAWVAQRERHLLATVPQPTLRGDTLAEVGRLLAQL